MTIFKGTSESTCSQNKNPTIMVRTVADLVSEMKSKQNKTKRNISHLCFVFKQIFL